MIITQKQICSKWSTFFLILHFKTYLIFFVRKFSQLLFIYNLATQIIHEKEDFVEEEREGDIQPLQNSGGDFEGGDLEPKFGSLEKHSHSSGKGNAYGNVKWSDVESNDGDLGDGIGIKYVYQDDTWNQKHFTYDPKLYDFVEQSRPNVFWNQFRTMMQLFGLFWSFNIL